MSASIMKYAESQLTSERNTCYLYGFEATKSHFLTCFDRIVSKSLHECQSFVIQKEILNNLALNLHFATIPGTYASHNWKTMLFYMGIGHIMSILPYETAEQGLFHFMQPNGNLKSKKQILPKKPTVSFSLFGFKFVTTNYYMQFNLFMHELIWLYNNRWKYPLKLSDFSFIFEETKNLESLDALVISERQIASYLTKIGVVKILLGHSWFINIRPVGALYTDHLAEEKYALENSIIIETDFTVYGYSNNPTMTSLLQTFSTPRIVLTELYIGTINNASCLKAFGKGVSTEMIFSLVRRHALPQMLGKNKNLLPATVVDQMRLWENENQRLQVEPAIMFHEIENETVFEDIKKKAEASTLLLWASRARNVIIIRSEQKKLP